MRPLGPGALGRRGVPVLPGLDVLSGGRGRLLPAVGVGLGLGAASLTAAAGVAAERLSRGRRLSVALDDELDADPFASTPTRRADVVTADGVRLHVEVDELDSAASGGMAHGSGPAAGVGAVVGPGGPVTRGLVEEARGAAVPEVGAPGAAASGGSVDGPGPAAPGGRAAAFGPGPDNPAADRPVGDARPTVVLSHGYCLSSRSWVFQRRALREAGYRVVVWDQRGHGASDPGPIDGYDIDRLGEDLAHVLRAAAPEGPLVLVGHSMGGMTMMALALAHPQVLERVVGAAFVATSPGGLSEVRYGLGSSVGGLVHRFGPGATGLLAPRQRLVDQVVRLGRDVVDFLVDWGSFASPVPRSVAHLTAEMIFGTRMEVIAAFLPRFDAHDKREALARFDGIETLVLSGVADRLTPPSHSEEIVRLVPGAEQILVADAGHVIMLEHPDVVTEHLLDLVRRAERSSTAAVEAAGGSRGASPGTSVDSGGGRRPIPSTVTDVASRERTARARATARSTRSGLSRPDRRRRPR